MTDDKNKDSTERRIKTGLRQGKRVLVIGEGPMTTPSKVIVDPPEEMLRKIREWEREALWEAT